jgi:hypothetical protein
MRTRSTTKISDTMSLIVETYEQLSVHYDPEVCNPLCLYSAAAAQGLVANLLDTYSPDFFDLEETEMVIGLHDLCGEILRQYEQMEDH